MGKKKKDSSVLAQVKIMECIAVVKEASTGWNLELNYVRWYENEPKFDLRWWRGDKKKYGKGMTLRYDELIALKEILEEFPKNSEYAKGMTEII